LDSNFFWWGLVTGVFGFELLIGDDHLAEVSLDKEFTGLNVAVGIDIRDLGRIEKYDLAASRSVRSKKETLAP